MGHRGKWAHLVLFAAVPLLVATAFLELLGPLGDPLSEAELARLCSALSVRPFLPGAITYAGITTIHFFTCIAAILFAWLILRSVPQWQSLALVGLGMASSMAILMLVVANLFGDSIVAYRLTYFAFVDLYRDTGVAASFLEPRVGSLTALGLAVYMPTVLGIFAVALMAAAATGQVRQLYERTDLSEGEREALLCLTHARVKRCSYVLSFVLVTSTVAAGLFFQLPSKYLSDATIGFDASGRALEGAVSRDEPNLARRLAIARDRVDAFAVELTMFWGAVYTLTLLALPLLLVGKQVQDFLEALKPPTQAEAARLRMTQAGAVSSGGEQIKVLLAFVAPLVSAPVTSFLQAATG